MAEEQLAHLQRYLAQASISYQREIVRLRQALNQQPSHSSDGPGPPQGVGVGGGGGGEAAGAGAGEQDARSIQLPPLAR